MNKKEEKINKAQKKAKELGHCLCNIKQVCECEEFKEKGICKCSEYIKD